MILTGNQIQNELGKGLDIRPFNPDQLGPNSYNLRLGDELLVYDTDRAREFPNYYTFTAHGPLDMKRDNPYNIFDIPKEGLVLIPGVLYLGQTMEYTETSGFVPMLEGRSSVGRLGINVHATAGFGDIGFCGYWTLEISCIQPVRIYPGVEICQIYYHTVELDDDPIFYKSDKYQHNNGIQPSMMWKDFDYEEKRKAKETCTCDICTSF